MGKRPDLSTLSLDLAARYALYETHRFCIRLPPEASLVDECGLPKEHLDVETLATFVHEYTHFTHNISTLAGWAAYELIIQLVGSFSHTLEDGGTCDPAGLDDNLREDVRIATRALALLEGAYRLPRHPSPPIGLRVAAVHASVERNGGVDFDLRHIHWEVSYRDGSVENHELSLGAHLIEEGIAYLLECAVRHGALAFDEAWTLDTGVPLFPYLAYQTLCRHYSPDMSALTAVRIGLLALNFNRPGEALIKTLEYYQTYRAQGRDDASACVALRTGIAPRLAQMLADARTSNVEALALLFEERGLLAEGIKKVRQWFSDGLQARETDIWFDLDWCSGPAPDSQLLSTRLRSNTPCDVIQERFGFAVPRDALISFSPTRKDARDRTLGGVRALQAQQDFMLGHLDVGTGFVKTGERGAGQACPYFFICVLPMRRDDPETCEHHPWTLWRRDPTCWYGAAVAGTLGRVVQSDDMAPPDGDDADSAPIGVDPIGDACKGRIQGWITDECWTNHVEPLMDRHSEALPGQEKEEVRREIRKMLDRLYRNRAFS